MGNTRVDDGTEHWQEYSNKLKSSLSSCRPCVFLSLLVAESSSKNRPLRRRSQDFLRRCTFLDQKSDDLFSHHLPFHGHVRYKLPSPTFVSHLWGHWGCTSPNSAPYLPHFNKKCLKIFPVALGGAPPASLWLRLWSYIFCGESRQ